MERSARLPGTILTITLPVLLARLVAAAESEEPPLERLLELNAKEVLGAGASFSKGRVSVKFAGAGAGAFPLAFSGQGVFWDPAALNAQAQNFVKGKEKSFTFVGLSGGTVRSSFDLLEDFRITFKLKIPHLRRGGSLSMTFNQSDKKSYVATSFFQDLVIVDEGKKSRVVTEHKHLQDPPLAWFDTRAADGVPVEVVFKEKKLSIFLTLPPAPEEGGKKDAKKKREKEGEQKKKEEEKKPQRIEVVSKGGIESPLGGKISWSFQGMALMVSDLEIEGKYSEEWAAGRIAELRKRGGLLTKETEAVAKGPEKAPAPPASAEKKTGGGSGLDKPDPEAEVDL
jgi:hypothetical protein